MTPLHYAIETAEYGLNSVIALELVRLPASIFGAIDADALSVYDEDAPVPDDDDDPSDREMADYAAAITPRTALSMIIHRSTIYGPIAPRQRRSWPQLCALVDDLCCRATRDDTLNYHVSMRDPTAPWALHRTLLQSCITAATSRFSLSGKLENRTVQHACALAEVLLKHAGDDGSGVDVLWRCSRIRCSTCHHFTALESLSSALESHPAGAVTHAFNDKKIRQLEERRTLLTSLGTNVAAAIQRQKRHHRLLAPTLMASMTTSGSRPDQGQRDVAQADGGHAAHLEPFPRVLAQLIAAYTLVGQASEGKETLTS
jgi:hypothetical protein